MDNQIKVLTLGFVNGKEVSTKMTIEELERVVEKLNEEITTSEINGHTLRFINLNGLNINLIALAYYIIGDYMPNEKLN